MPMNMCRFAIAVLLVVFTVSLAQDSLHINLSPDTPHRFAFTNKVDAFWYGEVQQRNSPSFMGYTIAEQRYLMDYQLLENDQPVERTTASSIHLFPDRLVREFPQCTETFWFVDSLPLVAIQLSPKTASTLGIQFKWDGMIRDGARWLKTAGMVLGHVPDLETRRKRAWIGVSATRGPVQFIFQEENGRELFTGVQMTLNGKTTVLVYFGNDSAEVVQTLTHLRDHFAEVLAVRKERIRRLLERNRIHTNNPQFNAALAWARISMDDLITRQGMSGVWAGLPWFNNYWGRDTFIAFRGALLTAGRFKLAREILQAFAARQNTNPLARELGRIPNRITLEETVYNTADGTGWFVKAVEHYVAYSGDTAFLGEIFPVVKKAIEGAIEKRMDEYGLLTHGDAETWMDAALGEKAWSPRGNRAVEIQVLWLEMLRLGSKWAKALGYDQWAKKWSDIRTRAQTHFLTMFWDNVHHRLVDHLTPNGSPNEQVRPNAIFALTVPDSSLLTETQQQAVLKEVVTQLVFPWGVASLAQDDPNFHPYHHYPPYYVPDAAYHNGVVWTWLSGPVLEALLPVNPSLAQKLLLENARQILELDGVGSQSELLEAWPREGKTYPQVSGTVSQAWNLAEFLRITQEQLLGIQPHLDRKELVLAPKDVPDVYPVDFQVPIGTSTLRGKIQFHGQKWEIYLAASRWPVKRIAVRLPGQNQIWHVTVPAPETGEIHLQADVSKKSPVIRVNGKPVQGTATTRKLLPDLSFARPTMDMNIPALQKPAYALLRGEDIARRPSYFSPIVFEMKDATGDDKGPNGRYVYPRNAHFRPGILDIDRVKIRKDKQYYYFEIKMKNLVDPGWHPEAGFQLTYLAIALNFGDKGGIRRTRVGHNANFKLPLEFAYNRIIYVGNGLEIRDGHEKILAAYFPAQEGVPLGSVKDRTIRFAIPIEYLSSQTLRNAVVLCGAQDDHGGGGIGDFRNVARTAGEWVGGGGDAEHQNPNVYDWLYIQR